ncbi:MAG: hypothetical protein WBN18_06370 [Flavobacteriaceae bacterium]
MNEYRIRPKDSYVKESKWQELYILTAHWKSDLLFYKDDLKFLHHLLDKYFIWITKTENLKAVQTIGQNILEDTLACDKLLDRLDKHLTQLARLIDNPSKFNTKVFRDEHEELEDEIAGFVKSVRENRKELFTLTEYVVDSERLEHLLDR